MSNYEYLDEIPRYRKKATAKHPKKSKHKHLVEPCVLEYPLNWFNKSIKSEKNHVSIGGYCPICGKLGDIKDRGRWYEKDTVFIGNCQFTETVATEEGKRELNPKTRTLPTFCINDPFVKFVKLSNGEEGE